METRDFCYWLQGFVEVHGELPSEEQWQVIKDHLQLVFKKESLISSIRDSQTFCSPDASDLLQPQYPEPEKRHIGPKDPYSGEEMDQHTPLRRSRDGKWVTCGDSEPPEGLYVHMEHQVSC